MAIDTAAKRFRIMDFDMPIAPALFRPDGTIDAGDRVGLLWLYFGGLDVNPEVVPSEILWSEGHDRVLTSEGHDRILTA